VLLGDYDKAEQLASRAVALEEQLHPAKDDPLVGDAYYNVACSILNRPAPDSAKLDIASKAAKQAVSIWLAADGPTSSTVDAADWLSRELTHHKRAGQAKSISQLIEAAKNQ
jgi:hypothetical protein